MIENKKIDTWQDVYNEVMPLLKEFINNKYDFEKKKFKTGMFLFVVILAIVLVTTSVFVFFGKMDDENFTFLLGILLGSLITLFNEVLSEK